MNDVFINHYAIKIMMSLPDFKEKQILFISTKESDINKVKFSNDNICFTIDEQIENQISCHKIFAVFIIGECSLTTVFIRNCRKYGISIFLMNRNFQTYANIISKAEGNYLIRQKQYFASEKNNLVSAQKLVCNKIQNQIHLLKTSKLETQTLFDLQQKTKEVSSFNDLLGTEGAASKLFFKSYFAKIGWYRRLPQTKIDITNLLMDIGYTFLFNFIDGMIGIYGLDSYIGFYHKLFFQRKSLSCDLMEPFRCIIDKEILKSYNLQQINEKDFKVVKGNYRMDTKSRDKYLEIFAIAIMDSKKDIFCYVRDYYYHIMNGADFPIFKIK